MNGRFGFENGQSGGGVNCAGECWMEQPANVISAIESASLSWRSLIVIASGNLCDPSIGLVICCPAIESGLANDHESHLGHGALIESAIGIVVLEIAIGFASDEEICFGIFLGFCFRHFRCPILHGP